MFNFIKKKCIVPKERGVYAFTKYRKGDFILFIEESSKNVYDFMQLPDRYKISFTAEEFTKGVSTKLIDFVEQVPVDVFEVSKVNLKDLEKKPCRIPKKDSIL
jgi:hypothetical protein